MEEQLFNAKTDFTRMCYQGRHEGASFDGTCHTERVGKKVRCWTGDDNELMHFLKIQRLVF